MDCHFSTLRKNPLFLVTFRKLTHNFSYSNLILHNKSHVSMYSRVSQYVQTGKLMLETTFSGYGHLKDLGKSKKI